MKAVVQDTYGCARVLEFRDIAPPSIGDEDVLVRVVAAGVDRGAWSGCSVPITWSTTPGRTSLTAGCATT